MIKPSARLLLGVAVPAVNILMSVLPLYVVNKSCHVTAMFYCQNTVPTYISVFESLVLSYIPLFIASTLVLSVYVSRLLGLIKFESLVTLLTPVVLIPPSASFSYICSQLPDKLLLRSPVSWQVEVHAELWLEKTVLGHYVYSWGPVIAATLLLLAELATARLKVLEPDKRRAEPVGQLGSEG